MFVLFDLKGMHVKRLNIIADTKILIHVRMNYSPGAVMCRRFSSVASLQNVQVTYIEQ